MGAPMTRTRLDLLHSKAGERMRYSGMVECCVCGIDCGPVDDWADEDGLPGHILQNAYECKECEARLDAEEAEKGGNDVKSRMKQ